jgi:hypothetical protein
MKKVYILALVLATSLTPAVASAADVTTQTSQAKPAALEDTQALQRGEGRRDWGRNRGQDNRGSENRGQDNQGQDNQDWQNRRGARNNDGAIRTVMGDRAANEIRQNRVERIERRNDPYTNRNGDLNRQVDRNRDGDVDRRYDRNNNDVVDRRFDRDRDGRIEGTRNDPYTNRNGDLNRQVDRNRDGSVDRRYDRNNDEIVDRRFDRDRDGRINERRDGNPRYGRNDGYRHSNSYGRDRHHGWNQGWRNDNRYNWRDYRHRYGNHYRVGRYYSPYRDYGYSRLNIGFYIGSPFYSSHYWINDPYYYRLPPVYGTYRWVRYYDDVLLVDVRNGYVVDVIHNFFW